MRRERIIATLRVRSVQKYEHYVYDGRQIACWLSYFFWRRTVPRRLDDAPAFVQSSSPYKPYVRSIPSIFRRSLTPDTDKAAHRAMTNPDGTHEVNGRTNGSPSADDRVALRKSVQQKTTRQYPNVNVPSSRNQSENTVERRNVIQQTAFRQLRPAFREFIQ